MSRFKGQTDHLPGNYRIARSFTSTDYSSGFIEIDFRTASWFGAAVLGADQTAAVARGELKQVNVYMHNTATAQLADEASPSDRYYQTSTNFPAVGMNFSNQAGVYQVWMKTSGAADFTIEAFFDIPSSRLV